MSEHPPKPPPDVCFCYFGGPECRYCKERKSGAFWTLVLLGAAFALATIAHALTLAAALKCLN